MGSNAKHWLFRGRTESYNGATIKYNPNYPAWGGGKEVYWSVDKTTDKGLYHNVGTAKTMPEARKAAQAFVDSLA